MANLTKKKDELFWESKKLREDAFVIGDYDKSCEMRKQQDEVYKKWLFYTNMIKANDKVRLRDK